MATIQHLAANQPTTRIAAARFKREVAIWDVRSGQRVATFPTILDYGGSRLAIDPEGELCAAGAYHRCGLACYNATSGEVVWHRKDLKRVRHLTFSVDGNRLLCGFESGPARALDSQTGTEIARWRATSMVAESPFQPWLLLHRRKLELRSFAGDLLTAITRETFATLHTVFGPSSLVISESGGPVRGFDLPTGELLWCYQPPPGHHVLHLGVLSSGTVAGVLWPYQHGGPKELLLFDPEGASRSMAMLGEPVEVAFVHGGDQLLLSDGRLLDVKSGVLRRTLPLEDSVAWGA